MNNASKRFFKAAAASLLSVLALGAAPCFAETETPSEVALNCTEFQAVQGESFSTTLYFDKGTNVADMELSLCFDTSLLTLTDYEVITDTIVANVDEKNGTINLTYSSTENFTDQFDIIKLTFVADEFLAHGKYDFLTLGKEDLNYVGSTFSDSKFLDRLIADNTGDLVIYQSGDADLNGSVQARDVTHIKQHVVHLKTLDSKALPYANAYVDFETDGTPKITSRDAVIIQQKIVKMDVTLGGRSTITFLDSDGTVYAVKSVKNGSALTSIPAIPTVEGYSSGKWSADGSAPVDPDFSSISGDMTVYAYYGDTEQSAERKAKFDKIIAALDLVFTEENKYVTSDFQLPYKNNFSSFNALTSEEFNNVDITWGINSGLSKEGIAINNYVVTVPKLDYTTLVTLTANIYIDGDYCGNHAYTRAFKGLIDLPDSSELDKVIDAVPETITESYRLPGIFSLEAARNAKDVTTVKNIEIKWSVIDGDKKCLDTDKNQISYLKDENKVILRADFYLKDQCFHSRDITRTIPAKSYDDQLLFVKEYLSGCVPSVFSGETLLPTGIDLYDLSCSWYTDLPSGKLNFGDKTEFNGAFYDTARLGEEAEYMEQSHVMVRVERVGDESFEKAELEFAIQLAGNSTQITSEKIPDAKLYKALLTIFDTKYGDKDGILTEEEIFNPDVALKINYTVDLSNKGIKNLTGINYLRNMRVLNLSGNNLSGDDANLDRLSELNNLEQLNLSSCQISEISGSVFSSKYVIEGVDLSYNYLKNLDFFKLGRNVPFSELTDLFLQGNYITDISALCFVDGTGATVSRIPSVKRLTLSRDTNYLETEADKESGFTIKQPLDITPIGYMTRLTTLWLNNNYICYSAAKEANTDETKKIVNENAFNLAPLANCRLLSTLDLSNNYIESTATVAGLEALTNLKSLVCLKLDNNRITAIKPLSTLSYLQVLSLSGNAVANFAPLGALDNIYYLDLDRNKLRSFDINKLVNLRYLYLESNQLEAIPNLSDATQLLELRLNYNKLNSTCYDKISTLSRLRYLSLNGNTIESLAFIQPLTNLTHLEIAGCTIMDYFSVYETDPATGEQKKLEKMNLSYLASLQSLHTLDISGNAFVTIKPLSVLTNLEVLYADRLALVDGADAITSMTRLRYLTMQNSGLTDLSFVRLLSSIEYLNLSGHKAPRFDFSLIADFGELRALFLDSVATSGKTEVTGLESFIGMNNLRYLSMANMEIGSIDKLPDMSNIRYLGLRNTGISNFDGTFDENEGAIYSITRFKTLDYLDVADNPDLFTKKNLNLLYPFIRDNSASILLYSVDAPEKYVPGYMISEVEAKYLTSFLDFGSASVDISAALATGYELPTTLNGFDITWTIEDNDDYYVEDGKLYFKNTTQTAEDSAINLTMNVHGLYAAEDEETVDAVTFTASIESKYTTKSVVSGTTTEHYTSDSPTLDGWNLAGSEPGGYTEWSAWSDWTTNPATKTDLMEVKISTREKKATEFIVEYYLNKRNSSGEREYRATSINGNYAGNNFSSVYGEHHANQVVVTQAQLDAAQKVAAGTFGNSANGLDYSGWNGSDRVGYVMQLAGTGTAMWFVTGEIPGETETVYSTRTRSQLPTKYFFTREVPIYEDESVLEGLSLVAQYKSAAQIAFDKAFDEYVESMFN